MKTALVVYADGTEDIEVTATADVLARGGVKVTRAAVNTTGDLTVKLVHGTKVECDIHISDCQEDYDLIAVPGGLPGAEYCRDNKDLTELLKAQHANKRYIGAICAAPGFVLATHKIITSGKATGYPGCEKGIANYTGKGVEIDEENRIITGKGPGYALEFGVALLEALMGPEIANRVAAGMLMRE